MTKIRLSNIAFDAGTQIRAAIDQHVVTDYADAMLAGATFPPIVLFHDGTQHYLADGFHRFLAAQRNEWRELDADVSPGTKDDALWFALGANRVNGHRLTTADKKHAVILAIQTWPGRSQRHIAEQVGCDQAYVQRLRAELTTSHQLPDRVVGRDGKSYPVSNEAKLKKREEVAVLVDQGLSTKHIAEQTGASSDLVLTVKREGD